MEEKINALKKFIKFSKETGVLGYQISPYGESIHMFTFEDILNELERLQKDNEALEYQLSQTNKEKDNIGRELIHRTIKLNKLLEENEELRRLDRTRVIGHINAIKIEDLKDVLSPYYIPKQVIRDMIEELKDNGCCRANEFYKGKCVTICQNYSGCKVLKELLGEC